MAVNERGRHQLYLKLEEVIGREEASILMAHLPSMVLASGALAFAAGRFV
jgi:hypothetical protein